MSSTETAATTVTSSSSGRRRHRPGAARFPARVLFYTTTGAGTPGSCNRTTARSLTRNGEPIQATFVFKRPPEASTLSVYSSESNPDVPPEVACAADSLLLLRVNVGRRRRRDIAPEDCDYFVYRANDPARRPPSLDLLRRPHPSFHNHDVGLLARPGGHYAVAALVFTGVMFKLHLFRSDTSAWSCTMVSEEVPPQPAGTPTPSYQLLYHHTTTVITVGGPRGTIAWVDLWRGVLLWDVLDPKPTLRFVPLPSLGSPLLKLTYKNLLGQEMGYPGHCRGISVVGGEDGGGAYLKFVHMGVIGVHVPVDETDPCSSTSFRVHDWTLTTFSNKDMSSSMDDWREECKVQASRIVVDDPAVSRVLEDSGLLLRGPRGDDQEKRDLHNLWTSQPTPCASGEDVVYLVARLKFRHPNAWVLAVDMKGEGRLRAVADSGIQKHRFLAPVYCLSRISKYLSPKRFKKAPVAADAEESSDDAGII